MVETADDVEHRGLARTRWAQNGDEFVVPKGNRYVVERFLREAASGVGLAYVVELQHGVPQNGCAQYIYDSIPSAYAVVAHRLVTSMTLTCENVNLTDKS